MRIDVLTLFPEMFAGVLGSSILKRAAQEIDGRPPVVSYRLTDVTLPGSSRQGTLHLNLARAWVLGESGGFVSRTVDLVGLSLSLK